MAAGPDRIMKDMLMNGGGRLLEMMLLGGSHVTDNECGNEE